MGNRIIKCIMDRKNMEPFYFHLGKILEFYDMGIYEKICTNRIIDEVGADGEDIVIDFTDLHLNLTGEGIYKCREVLQSYLNTEQMEKILDNAKEYEEHETSSNNMLWMLRSKSRKELEQILQEIKEINVSDEKSVSLCSDVSEEVLAEIRSRSVLNKARLLIQELFWDVAARIKYRNIFKILKKAAKETAKQNDIDGKEKPTKADFDRIIRSNYEKYRDIPQKKRSVDEQKKFVYYGMLYHAINRAKRRFRHESCFEIEEAYNSMHNVIMAAAELTPNDFLNMFPIDKKYDGEKYCVKDYFYTMESLKQFPMDKKIGDGIITFLNNYYSNHVFLFWCEYFNCINDYYTYCGIKGPFDEYFHDIRYYGRQEGKA